jgi:hypothetical protein
LKLGTENRKEVILLAVVGVIAVVLAGRAFWPSAPAAPASATARPAASARVSVRRTASGRVAKTAEPRLDPTLQLDLLRQSEDTKYAGMGRNIFVAGSLPIENPRKNGTTDKQAKHYTLPSIPPPPPINLKFFGFASKPGEPKKVFLSKGEDVFIAGEGDIVDRRYRILRISPASVDVEDVLNNNRQSIPLTQG